MPTNKLTLIKITTIVTNKATNMTTLLNLTLNSSQKHSSLDWSICSIWFFRKWTKRYRFKDKQNKVVILSKKIEENLAIKDKNT